MIQSRTGSLLEIRGLSLGIAQRRETLSILQDVDLDIAAGESRGVVGESGSGKTMTLRTVAGLRPRGAQLSGSVTFAGADVLSMSKRRLREHRARDIAVVPQNPRATTNPLRTIGDFLIEAPVATGASSAREARDRAVEALRSVGIADADRRLRQYPHELSGGLLQRVVIAAALLAEPRLILADEPTTALDVTTQEEVIAILDEQRRDRGSALMLVTHDLDLAAAVTDRISVVYAGVVVETAPSRDLHTTARHPYTAGLLAARATDNAARRLPTIPGRPVSAADAGSGCVFAARCPFVAERCRLERPERRPLDGHLVACHRAEEIGSPIGLPVVAEVGS